MALLLALLPDHSPPGEGPPGLYDSTHVLANVADHVGGQHRAGGVVRPTRRELSRCTRSRRSTNATPGRTARCCAPARPWIRPCSSASPRRRSDRSVRYSEPLPRLRQRARIAAVRPDRTVPERRTRVRDRGSGAAPSTPLDHQGRPAIVQCRARGSSGKRMAGSTTGRDEPFGVVLRAYREAANLSQEELAERAGLSVNATGMLERGVRRRPRTGTVESLPSALRLKYSQQPSSRG